MYRLSLEELGQRLRQVRNYIGLTQQDLAGELECKQNAVSRLEGGKGGSIAFLSTLLSYYSQYIYINYIFAEKFYLVSTDDKEVSRSNLDSIIAGILEESLKEHEKNSTQVIKKLRTSVERAVGLLKG